MVEHTAVNRGVVGSSPTRGVFGSMVKRSRHRPFTAVTRVRFPSESFRHRADVAQLAEQLICNQQVIGSSPIIGLRLSLMGGFPSGQRGQTVNLLQIASVVRIHLRPFN